MRKSFIASLCLYASLLFLTAAHAQGGLQQVSEHVYSYLDVQNATPANSYGVNAGIIVGDNSVAVVDTLISAKEGQRFLADIKAVTDKPVRYVINTHYHLDHTFGNKVFADLGAVIIAQVNCAAELHRKMAEGIANAAAYGLTPEQMAGTEPAYPTITFTDRLRLDLGGVEVELQYVSPSHSSGSSMVRVPGDKVVFAGDILFTKFYPYMGDGDIPGWQKNLDTLAAMDVERIIPGHGPLSGKADIADMRIYLTLFDQKARELVAGPGSPEQIVAELKKILPPRPQGEGLIQASIEAKYLPARTR